MFAWLLLGWMKDHPAEDDGLVLILVQLILFYSGLDIHLVLNAHHICVLSF